MCRCSSSISLRRLGLLILGSHPVRALRMVQPSGPAEPYMNHAVVAVSLISVVSSSNYLVNLFIFGLHLVRLSGQLKWGRMAFAAIGRSVFRIARAIPAAIPQFYAAAGIYVLSRQTRDTALFNLLARVALPHHWCGRPSGAPFHRCVCTSGKETQDRSFSSEGILKIVNNLRFYSCDSKSLQALKLC